MLNCRPGKEHGKADPVSDFTREEHRCELQEPQEAGDPGRGHALHLPFPGIAGVGQDHGNDPVLLEHAGV